MKFKKNSIWLYNIYMLYIMLNKKGMLYCNKWHIMHYMGIYIISIDFTIISHRQGKKRRIYHEFTQILTKNPLNVKMITPAIYIYSWDR